MSDSCDCESSILRQHIRRSLISLDPFHLRVKIWDHEGYLLLQNKIFNSA